MKTAVVILVLHWGGFTGGTAAQMQPHVVALRSPGVTVRAQDYPLNEPAAAERSVARVARHYRRSGQRVIAYGTSVGGTLALRLRELGAVDGAVAVSPVIDVPTWWKPLYGVPQTTPPPWSLRSAVEASPDRHPCGATNTRTLVIHAQDDQIAPFTASRRFARRCHAAFDGTAAGGHFVAKPLATATRYTARLVRALKRQDLSRGFSQAPKNL